MTPAARDRARLRLAVLLASLLDRVPPVTLGQIVEHTAKDDDSQLESRLAARTWFHDGLAAFVRELAERLQPELAEACAPPNDDDEAPPVAGERARAELTVMDWATVPVEVASELVERLARRCRATGGACFCGRHHDEGGK